MRRIPSLLVAAALLGLTTLPAAGAAAGPSPAVFPPAANPAVPVPNAPVAPPEPSQQKSLCARPNWAGPPLHGEPAVQRVLNLPEAWAFATGAGQVVAVIDTGVNPSPRLRFLYGGGDYVAAGDGLSDCDGHGTFVAGIIAAAHDPARQDEFAGVAPDAAILSIRQTSRTFEAKDNQSENQTGQMEAGGYGTVNTLADAVVHAVDLHATVINISEVSCSPAGVHNDGDAVLGVALKYAYDHNVVVVVSAGNVDSSGDCKDQNDGSGWAAVKTVATPAWWSQYVLSVASVNVNGATSSFSLDGPWVSVAAPGEDCVSLDSAPGGTGLVNGTPGSDGSRDPIDGTSFSSAFVAGEVALVRQRFPQWSARQVMDDVIRTAHAPGNGRDDAVGAGMIDPLAALTAQLPARPVQDGATVGKRVAAPPVLRAGSPWPRRIAVGGTLVCLAALGIGFAVAVPFRGDRRRKLVEDTDY
jgi:membrane-anchored mycosin MYCP